MKRIIIFLMKLVLAFAQSETPVILYETITGESESSLILGQSPELQALAAKSLSKIIIQVNQEHQTAIVQEGVNVNIDCHQWLQNFPNSTTEWFFRSRNLDGSANEEYFFDYVFSGGNIILEEDQTWLNITRTLIVGSFDAPSYGDYLCQPCSSKGTINESCYNAILTLHMVGAAPVLVNGEGDTTISAESFGDIIIDVGTNFCLNRSLNYQFSLSCYSHFQDLSRGIRTPIPVPVRTWTKNHNLLIYNASEDEVPQFNSEFFSGGNRSILLPGVLGLPNFSINEFSGNLEFSTRVSGDLTNSEILPDLQQRDMGTIRSLIFDEILGCYTCQLENVYGEDSATTVISECEFQRVQPTPSFKSQSQYGENTRISNTISTEVVVTATSTLLQENQLTTSVSIETLSFGIVFSLIGAVILFLGTTAILVWVRYLKRQRIRKAAETDKVAQLSATTQKRLEQRNFEMNINHDDIESESIHHLTVQSSLKLNLPRTLMIPSCRLRLDTMLGQGEFGMVYKGYIKKGYSDAINETVAVKTLKGFIQKDAVHDLLVECAKMNTFDHPNILKLFGVCLDGGAAPFIIMPFMANGSLKDYLVKKRPNYLLDPSSTDLDYSISVKKTLLDMCTQVAKGMEYLASKRVIHRDLAARNCMLDVTNVIKVADFGLAESLDSSKDYFRQDKENIVKLPIKWLAIESIHDGVFSEKTDVWSFGVTCWEIFSGGKTPYPDVQITDLTRQLDEGMRLEKPNNAAVTDEMYLILLKCWDSYTHFRPSFAELVKKLSNMLGDMAGYLDLKSEQ